MTSRKDVQTFEDIFNESWKEICTIVRERLKIAGIEPGAVVKYTGPYAKQRTFKIAHIDMTGTHETRRWLHCPPASASARVTLYGYQLRKDGTYGRTIHCIGRPRDVDVLK